METMLTTTEAASMTAADLRAYALTVPNRQLSLFCTRYAAAKDAHTLGDMKTYEAFLSAAKESYKRAMEDEHGQVARARAVAAVVAAEGAALDATAAGGKRVVKLAMGRKGATWLDSWSTR